MLMSMEWTLRHSASASGPFAVFNHTSESLPPHERHPFRDGMDDVLSKSLCLQEGWVTMTEDYLQCSG
jgi:hypothetical protein